MPVICVYMCIEKRKNVVPVWRRIFAGTISRACDTRTGAHLFESAETVVNRILLKYMRCIKNSWFIFIGLIKYSVMRLWFGREKVLHFHIQWRTYIFPKITLKHNFKSSWAPDASTQITPNNYKVFATVCHIYQFRAAQEQVNTIFLWLLSRSCKFLKNSLLSWSY